MRIWWNYSYFFRLGCIHVTLYWGYYVDLPKHPQMHFMHSNVVRALSGVSISEIMLRRRIWHSEKGKSSNLQIKNPSRVFGLIENPSGFGVSSLKPPKVNVFWWIRICLKFVWNLFLNVQQLFQNIAFWLGRLSFQTLKMRFLDSSSNFTY